jgi:hypothetical protein
MRLIDAGDVGLSAVMSTLGGYYGANGYDDIVYMGNGQFAQYQWVCQIQDALWAVHLFRLFSPLFFDSISSSKTTLETPCVIPSI